MNRYVKCLASLVATCITGLAMAQVPPPMQPASTTPAAVPASASAAVDSTANASGQLHALTGADLSNFFDGLVPFALRRGDVAGGVISVVKDGKVLFAKGYGYNNLKQRTVPSPADTLFRIGSTSKLFTWTAAMQLVQAGKLNLDSDVNDYLDFKIPPFQGKPITLRNLLTQSPGFEDTARNLISTDGKPVDLERYLKSHLPARIYPPGDVVAYSNYGCGLAGYIVQRVSGQSFDDYVEQHLFKPLDMQHSTFRQPLPAQFEPLMAASYDKASDGKLQPFEIVDPAPAGAMSSTALDMAHFMIAQLQGGSYDGNSILSPATTALMHTPQRTDAPGMNGYALGFYQENSHGQTIIGHAGDTDYFHTDLHLMLDADVGVFMSFNSAGNEGGAEVIRAGIFNAFLDRYFPVATPQLPTAATAKADAARVAGWYLSSRRNDSALRMLYALTQTQVSALPDGTIQTAAFMNPSGAPMHWREVGPLKYQQVDGPYHLDFVAAANGDIRYWVTDSLPPVMVFQTVTGLHTLGSIELLGTLSLLLLLATLLSWLCGWLVRRHYGRGLALNPKQRRFRLWSRLGVLALFVTLLGWLILMVSMASDQSLLLQGGATPWLYLLYALGVLALLGVVLIVHHTVRSWMTPRRGRWVLVGETLLALAAIYLAWLILALRMISFNVHY
ncbi:serine hydrolase domain-containing protein [Rhodanobacter glycinis]|uniref:CubicO group peptidase, beta-lactamase class C family n=1 Tax=Rhodanobacter glycinis TaxID=582702 RepID=A0A1I3XPB6_9GAMM|nr:serine hydrolase domain-containing protein [Rhodanobacter glycinis]SFK21325.1 CubicO group peptidase, beta-lactamase class C family [Rhodanobacter glycinis]